MSAAELFTTARSLLEQKPANEDEQEEWARVRAENIAAAGVYAHLADVALQVEQTTLKHNSHDVIEEQRDAWRKALRGS